ncbi:MAG: AAA family ATPase [Planctomycetota bacterium]|jgi:DNA repair protein RecN (Recombination protein N)|nr:AAA family ATPase [Planctomycetota bacterium]
MLLELHIRNLVILEQAQLEPGCGLTVISGETGAGKSLMLDALSLLLGGRGDRKWVGPYGDHTTVCGVFQVDAPRLAKIADLAQLSLTDEQVILRRRLAANGRSQAWINDMPVGVTTLKAVGDELVDIRVQHDHLRLARVDRQLELIDRFGGHVELAASYRSCHQRVLDGAAELTRLQEGDRDSLRELDYLRFLLREIDELDPQQGELAELEQRQRLLAGAQEWQELAGEATARLADDDDSVSAVLARLARRLEEAPDENLAGAGLALSQALEAVRDAAVTCAAANERLEADPGELARIDQRLAAFYDQLRKHGGTEVSLLAAREDSARRVSELENLDQRRDQLAAELALARSEREGLGSELATARSKAFKRLAKQVQTQLKELGMPKAQLLLHEAAGGEAGPHGTRHQEIYVRTNPGLPAGPLGEIASGGEAARLTLALAVPLAKQDDTPVLVFDEVDAGVGGRLGAIMGAKLAALAQNRTVLAVTHTPQLAAAADTNYLVRKDQGKDATAVRIVQLSGDDLLSELADMLGGGTAARQQAIALLEEVKSGS